MSNYGPKKYKQYKLEDNLKRKSNNVDTLESLGKNNNVKCYSTKPGQLSSKEQADMINRNQRKLNKKQPVKHYNIKDVQCPVIRQSLLMKLGLK